MPWTILVTPGLAGNRNRSKDNKLTDLAPGLLSCPLERLRMYNVNVDRAAMRQEILGPLFQRHIVSLAGTVDKQWLDSYEQVARDSESFRRYKLEPAKGLVSFTCRSSDGPKVIEGFLERLALFVEMVNLHATCASAAPAAAAPHSAPAAHEPPAGLGFFPESA